MAEPRNPLEAQPDLHRFSQAYRTIAEESEKLPNLPAIDAGHGLLIAIQTLTREVREGFASVREEFASVRVQMRTMYACFYLNLFIAIC